MKRRGRPPHVPTDTNRAMVRMLVAAGWREPDICGGFVPPISDRTLRNHYRTELATGKTHLVVKLMNTLFAMAVGRPAEYDEGKKVRDEVLPNPTCLIFACKTVAQLRETSKLEHVMQFDFTKLTDKELDLYERLARKASAAIPPDDGVEGEAETRH